MRDALILSMAFAACGFGIMMLREYFLIGAMAVFVVYMFLGGSDDKPKRY